MDDTVYDAMQLSAANKIPWFCMDEVFASLHANEGHKTSNVQMLVARAMKCLPFDFEHKRHGFLLYSVDALPLPLSYGEVMHIAKQPNPLASFILLKIFQNHGQKIFINSDKVDFLLDVILTHLKSRFYLSDTFKARWPRYTPWVNYTSHVFNHGIELFLNNTNMKTCEYRLALAISYMAASIKFSGSLLKFVIEKFNNFARGHFMDIDAIKKNLELVEGLRLNEARGNGDADTKL